MVSNQMCRNSGKKSRSIEMNTRCHFGLSSIALALTALPAFAQANDACATAPQTCATLIDTRAEAHTRIPNTAVDVRIGITTTEKDLSTAQRALSGKSMMLLGYLRKQQVQRLITVNVSFAPDVKPQKNAADRTVSYTGTLQVAFRTTPEKAPEILSGALSNGGNSIDEADFLPTEEEVTAARRELTAEATRNALAEVESVAKAAGLHTVAVRKIDVGNQTMPSPKSRAMSYEAMAPMAAKMAPPMATAAGEQELSVSVSVVVAASR